MTYGSESVCATHYTTAPHIVFLAGRDQCQVSVTQWSSYYLTKPDNNFCNDRVCSDLHCQTFNIVAHLCISLLFLHPVPHSTFQGTAIFCFATSYIVHSRLVSPKPLISGVLGDTCTDCTHVHILVLTNRKWRVRLSLWAVLLIDILGIKYRKTIKNSMEL